MIKIYGKVGCSSCTKAKALCAQGNIDYEYLELDKDFTREEMLEMFPQARTSVSYTHLTLPTILRV